MKIDLFSKAGTRVALALCLCFVVGLAGCGDEGVELPTAPLLG